MSSVLLSPLPPLSYMWLLAVRNMSIPQSAMCLAYSSGAENVGYPVCGLPARVNSMFAMLRSDESRYFWMWVK